MADKPKGSRDLIRFEPNERVDLPDLKALQSNSRGETRMLLHNFLFGHGDMGLPDNFTGNTFKPVRDWATHSLGLDDATTNWSKGGSLAPFLITTPSATTIQISAVWLTEAYAGQTWGGSLQGAMAGATLEDGTAQLGVAAGVEGDDAQILDYNGKPAGNYGVYVTGVFDPGELGTRLFWNAATEQEDTQAMDTRDLAGWTATTNFISGGPPSDAAVLVGTVVWDGAAITDSNSAQNCLFEGLSSSTGGTGPSGSYEQGWGSDGSAATDAAGHRSNTRLLNGITCWQDWAAALRRQLRDIIGDPDGDGEYGWWTEVPTFDGSGGSSGWSGEYCDLTHARDHIQLGTNPHGALLVQENLRVEDEFTVETSSGGRATTASLKATTVTLDGDPNVDCASHIKLAASKDMIIDGDNGSIVAYDTNAGETIDDGYTTYWHLGPAMWRPFGEHVSPSAGAVARMYQARDLADDYSWGVGSNGGGTAWRAGSSDSTHDNRLHASLSAMFPFGGGLVSSGTFRIWKILWYFYSNPSYNHTIPTAASLFAKRRLVGAASMGYWDLVKLENLSAESGGTSGDLDVPASAGPADAPVMVEWDLSGEPASDWKIGGLYDWELQVRLRGDGSSAFSPYFLGCTVVGKVGKLTGS